MLFIPLSSPVILSFARLFEQTSSVYRKPSHNDISRVLLDIGVSDVDPRGSDSGMGKVKRIEYLLYSLSSSEDTLESAQNLFFKLMAMLHAHGGFRKDSENYVGFEAFENFRNVLKTEGVFMDEDGSILPIVLENISESEYEEALSKYIVRAKRGSMDAALLVGTGKDLLEAVSYYGVHKQMGVYEQKNFPTLLGLAFTCLGISTSASQTNPSHVEKMELALYELGYFINNLRNKQGTGHGRPFLPLINDHEAKVAIESMGMISEYMMSKLREETPKETKNVRT